MKITITGQPGSGKSTVGKLLARELGYAFWSGGDFFRAMADEVGIPVHEFDEFVQQHPDYDRRLDERQRVYGETHDNFVLESRIGWFFIPDSFKVRLDCEFDERIRRVVEREGIGREVAVEQSRRREESYVRYQTLYGIENFMEDKHFDLVIDATVSLPPKIVQQVVEVLRERGYLESGQES